MNNSDSFTKSIARLIVAQVAPQELPLFPDLAELYFDDPTPPDLSPTSHYDPLSMGLGEVLVAVTPAATAVAVFILAQLTKHKQASVSSSDGQAQQRILTQSYSYETGLQKLLNQIPPQHPRHTNLLTLQARLTENMLKKQQYGDTPDVMADRFEIIAQLNRLALEVMGISFNALCGMATGMGQTAWQQMQTDSFQVAQTYGMTEEMAKEMANIVATAVLTALGDGENE